eukprot:scaffold20572_cov97-Skeletonema_menzelii.AAC.1
MVAICDGDVRRAMANEHRLLNALMSVSAGSKHVGINFVIHKPDRRPLRLGKTIFCLFAAEAESRSPNKIEHPRHNMTAFLSSGILNH